MTTIPKVLAVFQTNLVSNISASDTTFNLVPKTDKAGNPLSGTYSVVVDKGKSNEEFMLISITSNVATVIKRGIDPANPDIEVTALKFSHRRNAPVQFTDYTIIGLLRQILNGETDFSLPNLIRYASGLTPVEDGDLVSKAYADSLAFGGSISQDKLSVSGIAGETISAAGKLLYLKDDGKWWLADADTVATIENVILGMSRGSAIADGSVTGGVLLMGVEGNQSGATEGDIAYASNTAGGVSTTPGTNSKIIGVFRSATAFYFNPYFTSSVPIATSSGAGDAGKIIKTNSNGLLDPTFNVVPVVKTYNYADSPATWTKPAGLKFVRIQLWGGGGGGNNSPDTNGSGGGGGGGAYNERIMLASELGSTETVTVAAGGAVGAAGGDTSFGSHLIAYGGGTGGSDIDSAQGGGGGGGGLWGKGGNGAGNGANGAAGAGPTGFAGGAGGGNSAYWGGGGGNIIDSGGRSEWGGGGGAGSNAGNGGASKYGGAGGNWRSNGSVPGGGGGGSDNSSFSAGTGGNGRAIVTEYF